MFPSDRFEINFFLQSENLECLQTKITALLWLVFMEFEVCFFRTVVLMHVKTLQLKHTMSKFQAYSFHLNKNVVDLKATFWISYIG